MTIYLSHIDIKCEMRAPSYIELYGNKVKYQNSSAIGTVGGFEYKGNDFSDIRFSNSILFGMAVGDPPFSYSVEMDLTYFEMRRFKCLYVCYCDNNNDVIDYSEYLGQEITDEIPHALRVVIAQNQSPFMAQSSIILPSDNLRVENVEFTNEQTSRTEGSVKVRGTITFSYTTEWSTYCYEPVGSPTNPRSTRAGYDTRETTRITLPVGDSPRVISRQQYAINERMPSTFELALRQYKFADPTNSSVIIDWGNLIPWSEISLNEFSLNNVGYKLQQVNTVSGWFTHSVETVEYMTIEQATAFVSDIFRKNQNIGGAYSTFACTCWCNIDAFLKTNAVAPWNFWGYQILGCRIAPEKSVTHDKFRVTMIFARSDSGRKIYQRTNYISENSGA